MLFRDLLETNTDLHIEIFKYLNKKYGVAFTYYSKNFKEDKTVDFKYNGAKVKLYLNLNHFSSPVYDYEWI